MKKQILALSVCLTLSSTIACAATVPAKATVKVEPCVAKQAVKTAEVVKPEVKPVVCPEKMTKKKIEEKIAKERAEFYNALGLTCEQKAKAETLDKAQRTKGEPLVAKIKEEKTKLSELKEKKACPIVICEQKRNVRAAKKAFKAHLAESRKAFEALLTEEQLVKLKALNADKKDEHKKCPHKKHECPFCNKEVKAPATVAPKTK